MPPRRELPDFELEAYFSRWEFAAEHHLSASDAESMTVADLLGMGTPEDSESLHGLHLGYIPTWGLPELRQAVADRYTSLDPADVLTFAGAGEALFWAMQVFTGPGDHLIVTVPNYQSIESVPVSNGLAVDGLPLWSGTGEDLAWTLDLDRFERLLRPTTRLVAVNFPNNPTGFLPDHVTWRRLNDICRERNIRVISDEVYRGVEIDRSRMLPAAAEINPTAISVSVLSKAYGLPGLRVGWAATRDHDALRRLERAKHYTSICNAGPSEHLAVVALRAGDAILERNRAIIAAGDAAVRSFCDRHPGIMQYCAPDGGCVAFPRYAGPGDAASFCRSAVEEAGVLLLPPTVFRSDLAVVPDDRLRIGIGRTTVPTSLCALEAHLAG